MRLAFGFDPGAHCSAWALVTKTEIIECGVFRTPSRITGANAVRHQIDQILAGGVPMVLAYERAEASVVEDQHYKSREKAARSMIMVGQVAGAAMAMLPKAKLYCPTVWTKGIKKDVRLARACRLYFHTTEEAVAQRVDCPLGEAHNVLDAATMARTLLIR